MKIEAGTPEEYISKLPDDRKEKINKIREVILKNMPKGFEEIISYGMIGYCVPHSIYPAGYHCKPKEPLPFINLASQKGHIAIYHMGLYANVKLKDWFFSEHEKIYGKKIDAGKSCLKFKDKDQIPYELIGRLITKITPAEWIEFYEKNLKSKGSSKDNSKK